MDGRRSAPPRLSFPRQAAAKTGIEFIRRSLYQGWEKVSLVKSAGGDDLHTE